MLYVVPAVDGVLDIDYKDLQEGVQSSATECYVRLRDGAIVRPTWQVVTEQEFINAKEQMGLAESPA